MGMQLPQEISFTVEPFSETAGFVARWDDPRGGGITTQGHTPGELPEMITDAVGVPPVPVINLLTGILRPSGLPSSGNDPLDAYLPTG